jgi:uncharacterized protein (TIGR03382 family)
VCPGSADGAAPSADVPQSASDVAMAADKGREPDTGVPVDPGASQGGADSGSQTGVLRCPPGTYQDGNTCVSMDPGPATPSSSGGCGAGPAAGAAVLPLLLLAAAALRRRFRA